MTTALQIDFLLAGYRHPTTDEFLSGGKVKTFLDGTSTLSALWTDKDKSGAATNPVILDSSGKAEVYGDNIYKFEIYDSDDVLIETLNGVEYIPDQTFDTELGAAFEVDHKTDYTHIVYTSIASLRAAALTPFADQKISVSGYYAAGDGGGGDFYWDSTSTESDNNGTIIKVAAITTGRWKRIISSSPINGKWFGAKGDGVDDTTAVQEAITFVEGFNGELFYPDGTYKLTAKVEYTDTITITGVPNKTIFDMSDITVDTAFEGLGSVTAVSEALTAQADYGDLTISVADGSVFAVKDWCLLRSSAVTGSGGIPKGEICQIDSISINNITFKDPISDSYLVSDTATLDQLAMIHDVTFDGIKIIGGDTATDDHVGIFAMYNRNLTVRNCMFEKTHDKGIRSISNIGFQFINNRFEDILDAGTGYGMSITYACQDGIISGNVGKRMRHLVTHGGGSTYFGVPRRILIDSNVCYQSVDASFDAHSGAEDITFSNNESYGSEVDGIIVNCSRAKVTNNTVVNAQRYGIFAQLTSAQPMDILISGNIVRQNPSGGRCVFVTASNATYNTVRTVVISNNSLSGSSFGIDVSTTQAIVLLGVTITGNTIQDIREDGIQVADLGTFIINNNNILVEAGKKGIQVITSNYGVISGNIIKGELTDANTHGINIDDSKDLSITGNLVRGSAKGIFIDDDANNIIIMSNNLRTCTTELTPGALTNKIYETAAADPYNML